MKKKSAAPLSPWLPQSLVANDFTASCLLLHHHDLLGMGTEEAAQTKKAAAEEK